MNETAPVAVTGASGFIGSAVIRSLRQAGRDFVAFGSRAPDALPHENWQAIDLTDPSAVSEVMHQHRPAVLIHTAWARARAGGLWHMEENWHWRDSSMTLFEAFWSEGGERVVSCGTCAEYVQTEEACSEDLTPIRPGSIYGQAKAELHERAAARAAQLGNPLAWARLFYLFGPNEAATRLVPSVVDSLLAVIPARTGSGMVERDFAFVNDIADGLVALADAGVTGPYNVASGRGIQQRQLVGMIGELMQASGLLRIGELPDRPDEAPRIVADVAKIMRDTGWEANTSLADGLRQTIAWRRNQPPRQT